MANGSTTGDDLSRRKLLATALTGTAAGIAGCGGGNGGSNGSGSGGNGSNGNSGSSPNNNNGGGNGEQVIDMNVEWLPGDANWNHLSNGPGAFFWAFDYTNNTYWNDVTDWWLLKEDGYNYDSKTKTVTYSFRPEYGYWWNGDPVTAEDYRIQQEIERLQDPEGSDWESWTLEDKYTLKGKRKNEVNPMLLNAGDRVMEYRGAYRQWYEQLKEDTTTEARDNTLQELTQWQISTDQFTSDGLGNGTYKLDDWSTTEMTWTLFEDHPYADQVPFDTVKWHVGSGSAANQQITNDTIDISSGQFPGNLRRASPEYLQTLYTHRSIQVRNLLFNYTNKHIGRRNVRRALISILDFTRLVDFWNEKGGPVKQRQTGLPQSLEDEWLGDNLMNNMVNYPLKSDPERAERFMQKAGYSKQSGTWVGPDGDPLEFTLMIGTYLTSETLGRAITQTWSQWGANAELKPVSDTQWSGMVMEPQGDWDITIWLHGFDRLDPLNYFDSTNPYHMRLGNSQSEIEGWLQDGETNSQLNGKPLTLAIPSTPSLEVGNNGGQQINIYELVQELRTTQSNQRSREIIRILSRYFNYDLPMFDMFPQTAATWGDTKNFQWPNDADVWHQKGARATAATLRKGILKPPSNK